MTVVAGQDGAGQRTPGWWGNDSALLDDEEARRRLVAATGRCLARRGTSRIRIEEVAVEAGVSRSTVYRYFKNRNELILAVLLSRVDVAMTGVISSLPRPEDAAASICDVFLKCTDLINGDAVNEALFTAGSRSLAETLELTAEPIVDAVYRHLGPLLRRWRDGGQLAADLDLRETVRWMMAAGVIIMSPPWSGWSPARKRAFVDRYITRALVGPALSPPGNAGPTGPLSVPDNRAEQK
ncbi:TetR/AcrR family transcriptional regulator [Frankia sp. CNm7]|uniref:TetR/AcrR family transcriptional regulator n=1 Tax=Frankia nepalensis TaxID=1836974 RepID=A0A937RG26_9ACTN|nr:TetR/AcrR family transcriptional regulator [Frankia nepalensis]MBL7499093.1 TetR/AcrR family transcriptional regulator [Frankia nepalensis]MBL7511439.1 TetR/AcrR family transcriptional regulator [Frankia nepalensis]MBL7517046.1 TetR/AcrR family transcriptional regulator [Frankia nepalensis]MBL7629542.1 TetR/AcrR family transcriptional regulator [Frankia nepalensis]